MPCAVVWWDSEGRPAAILIDDASYRITRAPELTVGEPLEQGSCSQFNMDRSCLRIGVQLIFQGGLRFPANVPAKHDPAACSRSFQTFNKERGRVRATSPQ